MTPQEKRRFKRHRKQRLWNIVHTAILFCLTVTMILVLGNLWSILEMQTKTYGAVVNLQTDLQAELYDIGPDFYDDIITPPEEIQPISLFLEERALIERVVMSESSIEPFEAKVAVAQTIYDRMNDWGDPLPVAIRTYSTADNGEPTDSVKEAVSKVFDKGERVYEGGTYQFHDDSVNPYWTEGKIDRGSIGNLRFYGGYE